MVWVPASLINFKQIHHENTKEMKWDMCNIPEAVIPPSSSQVRGTYPAC